MLLTTTINAANTNETILAGNGCTCAIELRVDSASSVQFADWQPVHRQAKRTRLRPMCDSGYPGPGSILPSSLPGCSSHVVPRHPLSTVLGCVTVS